MKHEWLVCGDQTERKERKLLVGADRDLVGWLVELSARFSPSKPHPLLHTLTFAFLHLLLVALSLVCSSALLPSGCACPIVCLCMIWVCRCTCTQQPLFQCSSTPRSFKGGELPLLRSEFAPSKALVNQRSTSLYERIAGSADCWLPVLFSLYA